MKFYLLYIFILCSLKPIAQTSTDIASSKELTWYGIDFSQVHFVNTNWNIPEKDLKSFVKTLSLNPLNEFEAIINQKFKRRINFNLAQSEKRNNALNLNNIQIHSPSDLGSNDIKRIVDEYEIHGKGYGVLLIVEEFNKDKCYIWAAFINNNTGGVVSTRRYVCEDGHGSLEKRWLKAIETAIAFAAQNINSSR